MNTLRLGLLQYPLAWESPHENREFFRSVILSLKGQADIIALPEMFTTGFSMNTDQVAETSNTITHRWMLEMAAETGACITGSYMANEAGMYFNRLIWAFPDGSYQVYDKKHLFRMADEHLHYTAGNSRLLIEYNGWRILPLICYDLRFPAWCRNHYHGNSLDYDLMLVVANWPSVRSEAWDALLKARAIENHAYCAGLNRTGEDGNGKEYAGHSGVYDPRGKQLQFSEIEGIMRIDLEMEPLELYRAKFPAYLDSMD